MKRDNLASEAKTLKQEVEEQQGKVKAATTQMAAAEASVINLRKEQELAVTKLLSVQREVAEGQKRLSALLEPASQSRPAHDEAATAMKGNPSTAPAAGVTTQDPKTTRDEAIAHTRTSNRSWVSWIVSGAVAVVGLVIAALLITRIRRGLMAVELTHICGNGSEAFRVVVHPHTEDILLANKGPEAVATNAGNEARSRVSVSRLGRLLLLPGQHDEDMAVNGASISAGKVGLHVGDRIEMGSLNQRETWVIEAVERADVGEEFEPAAAQAA
jgi:hypothetical protein